MLCGTWRSRGRPGDPVLPWPESRHGKRDVSVATDMTVGVRHGVLGVAAAALCASVLSACGSSGVAGSAAPASPAASTASASASASASGVRSACQQVAAVLSDGPDPGVDPVGYAEAQILPLRRLHPSDRSLRGAIHALASAYARFYDTDGAEAAQQAVTRAGNRLDVICPGAAS